MHWGTVIGSEADAEAFAEASRRYSAFYQPAGDGRGPALRKRMAEVVVAAE